MDENSPHRGSESVGDTVSRDLFRQVIHQRQQLKKELRALKESLADLPEDWRDRLDKWLDLEARAESLERGELIDRAKLEAERAGWEDRERDYQNRIGRLTLADRIRTAAAKMAAYDPDDVVALTKELFEVRFEGGEPRIGLGDGLEKAGLDRYRDDGSELTLDEVIARFLEKKPHLIRAKGLAGSGSRPRLTRSTTSGPLDPAEQARQMLAHRLRVQGRPSF